MVQDEIERLVVSANDESATPEIRTPMLDRLGKTNEFLLVHRQGAMSGRKGMAEEYDGIVCLVENCHQCLSQTCRTR